MASVVPIGAFMQGFLNGYKAFPDSDDREYKKLRNKLTSSRADYWERRQSNGPQDRAARDALARKQMEKIDEQIKTERFKRQPQETEGDRILGPDTTPAQPVTRGIPPRGGVTPLSQNMNYRGVAPGGTEDETYKVNHGLFDTTDDFKNGVAQFNSNPQAYLMSSLDPNSRTADPYPSDRSYLATMGAIPSYATGGAVEDGYDEDEAQTEEDNDGDDYGYSEESQADAEDRAGERPYSLMAAHDAVRDGLTRSISDSGLSGAVPARGGAARHLTGAGALTAHDMDRIRNKVDPEGKLDPADRNMKALSMTYQYYLRNGDPASAQRMASSMVGSLRHSFDMNKSLAAAAAQDGNTDGAVKYAMKAYESLPDGNKFNVSKNPDGTYSFNVEDVRTHEAVTKPKILNSQQMLDTINQASQEGFDGLLASAAGVRAKTHQNSSPQYQSAMGRLGSDNEDLTEDERSKMPPHEMGAYLRNKAAMAKANRAPAEPRAGDYDRANKEITAEWDAKVKDKDGNEKPKYDKIPPEYADGLRSIATDIAARNRVTPHDAISATNELGGDGVTIKPLPGGGGVFKLKNGQQYNIGSNGLMKLAEIKSGIAATKKAQADKEAEEASRRSKAAAEEQAARSALEGTRKPGVAINPYSRHPQTAIPQRVTP